MSLCLLLWRQLVSLWRNLRGQAGKMGDMCVCLILPSHVALALLVFLPCWGSKFPHAKVIVTSSKWEMGSRLDLRQRSPPPIPNKFKNQDIGSTDC
ncbi:hypothetical protein EJB05_02332 [Eragrostis curvula]|uniref:Uncharacterized protein n=1 Tax=Eragrostis curvula TaxID=38414 RepID=A0A5J9WS11_9POAL|nr:hypothetical protein EJB05_02331 [Eragrostis curvula]TVU50934.1 hypothetical protein EJB05_02332 [Eragrostis curvula]